MFARIFQSRLLQKEYKVVITLLQLIIQQLSFDLHIICFKIQIGIFFDKLSKYLDFTPILGRPRIGRISL